MRKNILKIEINSAKLALQVAKIAAGNASWWGFFQPKEPESLKKSLNNEDK